MKRVDGAIKNAVAWRESGLRLLVARSLLKVQPFGRVVITLIGLVIAFSKPAYFEVELYSNRRLSSR